MSLNDIYNLPASEKLHLIEKLWDGLEDTDIISPDWHKEILDDRKKRYENGEVNTMSSEAFKNNDR